MLLVVMRTNMASSLSLLAEPMTSQLLNPNFSVSSTIVHSSARNSRQKVTEMGVAASVFDS